MLGIRWGDTASIYQVISATVNNRVSQGVNELQLRMSKCYAANTEFKCVFSRLWHKSSPNQNVMVFIKCEFTIAAASPPHCVTIGTNAKNLALLTRRRKWQRVTSATKRRHSENMRKKEREAFTASRDNTSPVSAPMWILRGCMSVIARNRMWRKGQRQKK